MTRVLWAAIVPCLLLGCGGSAIADDNKDNTGEARDASAGQQDGEGGAAGAQDPGAGAAGAQDAADSANSPDGEDSLAPCPDDFWYASFGPICEQKLASCVGEVGCFFGNGHWYCRNKCPCDEGWTCIEDPYPTCVPDGLVACLL